MSSQIAHVLGDNVRKAPIELERDYRAGFYEQHFDYLREYRPGGWKPKITVTGTHRIDDAFEAGRGAILWVSLFTHLDLLAKKAVRQEGYKLHHLSRYTHWTATSRFGQRFINPARVNIETRYLHERVLIGPEGERKAMKRLRSVLKENGLVSITVGNQGRQLIEQPLLNGHIDLTTGPANLARISGARLLPVFLVRHGPAHYEVVIDPPLQIDTASARDVVARQVAVEYAQRITPYLIAKPALFRAWEAMTFAAGE